MMPNWSAHKVKFGKDYTIFLSYSPLRLASHSSIFCLLLFRNFYDTTAWGLASLQHSFKSLFLYNLLNFLASFTLLLKSAPFTVNFVVDNSNHFNYISIKSLYSSFTVIFFENKVYDLFLIYSTIFFSRNFLIYVHWK